ncbi:hypothetical protein ACLB2K_020090 [Fragaria x ananassa]
MCKMVIIGKRKDPATKASALMDSIRQSVGSASTSSHPTVDSSSTRSPSSTSLRPPKRSGVYVLERRRRISLQKRAEDQAGVLPLVKGHSLREINSLVTHDISSAIRSLVGMRARTFYDLDQEENWKRLSLANKRNIGEKTMHHHTGSSPIIYTMEELRIQGEQLPIIKGFEKTHVRAGDEDTTKKYVTPQGGRMLARGCLHARPRVPTCAFQGAPQGALLAP